MDKIDFRFRRTLSAGTTSAASLAPAVTRRKYKNIAPAVNRRRYKNIAPAVTRRKYKKIRCAQSRVFSSR